MSTRSLPAPGKAVLYCAHQYKEARKMKGAIIGDIIGSRFEWENIKVVIAA